MYQDPIPPKDVDFNSLANTLVPYLDGAHNPALNITAEQLAALDGGLAAWTGAYAATLNPATVTSAAVAVKNTTRAAFEAVLRPIIRQLKANPAVTDDLLVAMGLHPDSHTRSRAAVPATAPQLAIRNGLHLEHLVDIKDSASPNSKAKPAGVVGCKLYCQVGGAPPADTSGMALLEIPTDTPYHAHFTGAQAGLVAYYRGCWVNTHKETGPWSDLVSATIPG